MRHRQNDANNQNLYNAYRRPDPSQGGYGSQQGGQDEPDGQPYEEDQPVYDEQPSYDGQAPYEDQPSYGGQPPYEEEQAPYDDHAAYDQHPYYGEQPPYQQEPFYDQAPPEPELVSTSQAINLTCTLAALSGLFALFLYIADKRSEAVRRISVQSIVLSGGFLGASLVLWLVGTILRVIPFLGVILMVIFWLLFCAVMLAVIYLKVQMMLKAYQGYAYQLPVIGERLRRFE